MADLPRYQLMGVQFADLPRVPMAAQQAAIEGLGSLSRSVDRMTAFFEEEATTQAKRQALKYSIDTPPTREQLETALKTGQTPKIKGAGSVFQDTYNAAVATNISSDLQLQATNKIAQYIARVESGERVDPAVMRQDIKDMTDGFAQVVMAYSPEKAIQLRAAITSSSQPAYQAAVKFQQKVLIEERDAQYTASVDQSRLLVRNILATADSIDPETGKSVDIEKQIRVLESPFMEAIKATGTNKYVEQFRKMVTEEKIGGLELRATSADFAPSTADAIKRINAGDFGSMTGTYKTLSPDDQIKVRERVLKRMSDVESARKLDDANAKETNRKEGNTLTLEFINPSTPLVRKQEIVKRLVEIDQMTLQQAQDALKRKAPESNPQLEVSLYQQIKSGQITNIGQLSPYAGRLSDSQYESLGRSVVDVQHRSAVDSLTRAAGITDNMLNPAQEKINQKNGYLNNFQNILSTRKPDGSFPSPAEAAKQAIAAYESDKSVQDRKRLRDRAQNEFNDALTAARLPAMMIPLEQVDVSKIQGVGEPIRKRLLEKQQEYKNNL
jgi:hypothetical protein